MHLKNFILLDSVHGQFIVPRTCTFQAEALVKTGRTHIESELANIFIIVDTLGSDSIIVDGGANAGFFTIPVAHRTQGRNTRIISFEPQRQLFQALGGSLALNGYDHVYLHNCGLSDQPGIAQLPVIDYSVAQDFGTVQLTDDCNVEESGWMNNRVVDVTSIDAMDLPGLDFFKLDVEGYEVSALTGALQTIQKYQPWIWVEYFITGIDPIKQALSSLTDYDYYIADYQNMLCVPRQRANLINVSGLQKV
jgi:FkbM family methyltransferase